MTVRLTIRIRRLPYNLRFPGQYYMAETGLNQNWERDYDPVVGRYPESDPIGLYGRSWSTYSYAGGNPISNVDPSGISINWGVRESGKCGGVRRGGNHRRCRNFFFDGGDCQRRSGRCRCGGNIGRYDANPVPY